MAEACSVCEGLRNTSCGVDFCLVRCTEDVPLFVCALDAFLYHACLLWFPWPHFLAPYVVAPYIVGPGRKHRNTG